MAAADGRPRTRPEGIAGSLGSRVPRVPQRRSERKSYRQRGLDAGTEMAMQACPRCGVKVKAANMAAHMERMHPQPGSYAPAARRAETALAALMAEGCPAALARAAVSVAEYDLEEARRALADPELRAWVPTAHALDAAQLFPVPEALEDEAAALVDAWLAQPGLEEGVRNELEWRRAPLPGGYLAAAAIPGEHP